MRLRNYSERTITTYLSLIRMVSRYYKLSPDKITIKQIKAYLNYRVEKDKISVSTINQTVSAFKLLFERVLEKEWDKFVIIRPRREKKLPVILSKDDIKKILDVTGNLKHRAIIVLAYSSGLRLSELCNLRIKDIDSKRMQIRVANGKGKRDRYSILSINALSILRLYYKEFRPHDYLFFGYYKNQHISQKAVQHCFRKALKKTGIKKDVNFHTLRHSFATHLLEQNVNIKVIQMLLGHSSIRTTMIYTHLVNIKPGSIDNPFDTL